MSRPLTALVVDYHRFLRGLLMGIDPGRSDADHDGSPLLVLIQMCRHNVHEANLLVPLLERDGSGGSLARSINERLGRIEQRLAEFEQHPVGSREYDAAVVALQQEFERHANEVEAALPEIEERLDAVAIEPLRELLGPMAAETARLPDQVRREFAEPGWPRPGLAQTLKGLFTTRLRQTATH